MEKDGVTFVSGARLKSHVIPNLYTEGVVMEDTRRYDEIHFPEKTSETRSFIKVQDGCDNFCSYCLIPYLRGRSRSRNPEAVVEEIRFLNPLEAVITGIDLSSYDYEGKDLSDLMKSLKDMECRIRLGSLEASVITEEFMKSLKDIRDFAPHFHLSLQSGSDVVLKTMNRHYTSKEFLEKCDMIRKYFPDAGITTDIIVGYSTETEEYFLESLDTARKAAFSDIHCFPYSRRQGTVGAKLKPLPDEVKKERMERMLELKHELKKSFIDRHLGDLVEMIPETFQDGKTDGYSGNYIRCHVQGKLDRKKYKAKILEPFGDGVLCEILGD